MAKRVITYGTFDLFHVGHLKIFQRAKEYGDELVVAVSTDEFNKIKNKKTIVPYLQRREIVSNIKCVDMVIPEENWEQKRSDIKKYDINILIMGHDWEGKFDDMKDVCKVIYLPRTEGVSSTGIKTSLKKFISIDTEKIKEAIEVMEIFLKDLQ